MTPRTVWFVEVWNPLSGWDLVLPCYQRKTDAEWFLERNSHLYEKTPRLVEYGPKEN